MLCTRQIHGILKAPLCFVVVVLCVFLKQPCFVGSKVQRVIYYISLLWPLSLPSTSKRSSLIGVINPVDFCPWCPHSRICSLLVHLRACLNTLSMPMFVTTEQKSLSHQTTCSTSRQPFILTYCKVTVVSSYFFKLVSSYLPFSGEWDMHRYCVFAFSFVYCLLPIYMYLYFLTWSHIYTQRNATNKQPQPVNLVFFWLHIF